MNMDFKSAEELLNLCEENQLPISEVMRQRECLLGEVPRDSVNHRMGKAWEIMRSSATQPLKKPIKSMGGLIGGEAKKLEAHDAKNKSICGDVLEKAIIYAMAVLEANQARLGYVELHAERNIAKLSIVGAGMMSNPGVAAKMFESLYNEGVNINMISTSEIRVTVLINEKDGVRAMNAVHDAFNLAD